MQACLVIAIGLAMPLAGHTQPPGEAPLLEDVAVDDHGFIQVQGTVTPGHLRSDFTVSNRLEVQPTELPDPHQRVWLPVVSLRATTGLQAQLGFGDRFAAGLSVAAITYQHGNAFAGTANRTAQALLDPGLRARYRLIGAVETSAGGRADGPGLALELGARLPFGNTDAFAGGRGVRGDATALFDFQLLGAGLGAHLGIRHRFYGSDPYGLRLRNQFRYGIAAKMPMPFWPPLTVLLEWTGSTNFRGAATSPSVVRLGARLSAGEWSVLIDGGIGAAGRIGSPDGVVTLGLRYSPQDPDTDNDGLADGDDECPLLPEDLDGFRDDDGCEDPDNDNDFIPDADDLCPNEEALEGRDEDEDGCTDPPKSPTLAPGPARESPVIKLYATGRPSTRSHGLQR